MYHNFDGQQQTHYCYFVDVNNLLNDILLHTVINAIRGLAYLTMLAEYLITMVVVVTLGVMFLHKAILVELSMCENTETRYRKVIFGPTLLTMTPLVINYSVVTYLTVVSTPQVCIIWKTAL